MLGRCLNKHRQLVLRVLLLSSATPGGRDILVAMLDRDYRVPVGQFLFGKTRTAGTYLPIYQYTQLRIDMVMDHLSLTLTSTSRFPFQPTIIRG